MNLVGVGMVMVMALAITVVGGCAPSAVVSPPGPTDTGARPLATETPSNFASPTDLFQRYPTMRHQQL
jgi:hypothetical protein